jgi:hypothetical protein
LPLDPGWYSRVDLLETFFPLPIVLEFVDDPFWVCSSGKSGIVVATFGLIR